MGHRAHLGRIIWILSLSEVSRKQIRILTYEVARLIIWLIRAEEWPSPWPSLSVPLEQIGVWSPEWSLGAGNYCVLYLDCGCFLRVARFSLFAGHFPRPKFRCL